MMRLFASAASLEAGRTRRWTHSIPCGAELWLRSCGARLAAAGLAPAGRGRAGAAGGFVARPSRILRFVSSPRFDAAKSGDWILIGPGDYHERGDRTRATAHWPRRARAS